MPLDLYRPVSEQAFDPQAYLLANPDLRGAGLDLLESTLR